MQTTKNFKCAVDGRLFATQAALKQHSATKHAVAAVRPNSSRNTAGGRRRKSNRVSARTESLAKGINLHGQTAVLSGSDLVGSITISDDTSVGTILVLWDCNPLNLETSRLHRFAAAFTRWRPHKLHFTCVPGAGVFTPGSYAMGWTGNPDFSIGTAGTRLARVSTLTPSLLSTFGQPKVLQIPCDTAQKWYYCHSEDEGESDHGAVIAVLAARCGGKNITLNFRLEWTIEFSAPDVPSQEQELETYPDPDYIPIFTDSTSDWAEGKKLTFKHKEGGSVVPFHGLKSNVVYRPAVGVEVPYYKADGTAGKVGFFAKIKDSPLYPSGLACFETEAKAKAYIAKSDVTQILDYNKAGEYVTPVFPTFVGKELSDEPLLDLRRKKPTKWLAPGTPSLNIGYELGQQVAGLLVTPASHTSYGLSEPGPSSTSFNAQPYSGKGPSLDAEGVKQ
ncbi:hypothetical protein [Erysiphe necator associated nodavirus 3]|nr:hypothetical protein [Erysiphe necator associated nodavirus 3]